jgi:type I restriction enzyme S subunit
MGEWRMQTVEELAARSESAMSTGPFGSEIGLRTFRSIGVPVIRGSNLSSATGTRLIDDDFVYVDDELAVRFKRSLAKKGDIVFTCWGTINQVGLIDGRTRFDIYLISNKQMKMTPDCCKVLPLFVYYFFSSPAGQQAILDQAIGSSVPGFNLKGLKSILVPVPPINEQRSIVEVLGLLDDKIELNRRMNETLEAMARAIFKDWFIDFGPTRAKMEGRAPYFAGDLWSLFPDRLDDDGKPEGWLGSTIGEEVVAVGGSTPSTEDPGLWDGGISWATPKDLSNLACPVLLETNRTISSAGLRKIGSGLLPPGTVLLSSRAPIGYIAISEIQVAINQGFIAMQCTKRLPNVFVWLWTVENLDTVLENGNGSTFQEISKRNFRPIRVVVPSEAVVAAFEGCVRPLYQRMVMGERESRTLAAARDLLLPKLISGEIRLRDAEKAVEAAL